MDGIILIDKEEGYTSFDVCHIARKSLKTKKIGHSGTLDPFATGLLVITVGKSTKINQFLETLDKEYIATLCLGQTTTTLDTEGEMIDVEDIDEYPIEHIEEAFASLIGEIEQIPPMYSALKVNGKKLYEYAREGIEVERKVRKIKIYSLEIIDYKHPFLTFKVRCSKGTYVRTLGQQIAEKLSTVGYLISLRRNKVGKFNVDDANSIEELKNNQNLRFIPIIKGLSHYKTIIVDEKMKIDIMNGKKIRLDETGELLAITQENEALAILEKNEFGQYIVKRGLW